MSASAAELQHQVEEQPVRAPRLPPVDRVHNHAAAELLELMTDDAYNALVSACDDRAVRAATRKLLAALVKARDRKPTRKRR